MRAADEELAASLLREAVFAARARSAAGRSFAGIDLQRPTGGPGNCGLGEKPELESELGARGVELLGQLWPQPLAPAELERLRAELAAWVGQQDGLDRARNHFLRDFRAQHGADRRAWSAETARDYERGIAALSAREDARLREHARALLAPSRPA
jgi:hypothetical protein